MDAAPNGAMPAPPKPAIHDPAPAAKISTPRDAPTGDPPQPGANLTEMPNDQKPRPTTEEILRSMKEEAAAEEAALKAQRQLEETEMRRQRLEERVKFRTELRQILDEYRNKAGVEIDKLCLKYGNDPDAERYAQARLSWTTSRKTQEGKVRFVRWYYDLPEPAILNLISDDMHNHLGGRNGPRDSNELRVRAAKLLLTYPLPQIPAAARSSKTIERGANP
jgi:hypothetical protein